MPAGSARCLSFCGNESLLDLPLLLDRGPSYSMFLTLTWISCMFCINSLVFLTSSSFVWLNFWFRSLLWVS